MSSNIPPLKLTVAAVGVMAEFAHITVYNGHLEDIARGYERLDLLLPPGIYSITLKLDGHIRKEHIRLTEDTLHEIPTPPVYSSLVADHFESSHEYYTQNAQRYSHEPTVDTGHTRGGAIFLFFRYTDIHKRKELNTERHSLGDGFSLLDAERRILYPLCGNHIREDTDTGWMAFHAVLPPGTYYLHYTGCKFATAGNSDHDLPPREIPVQVFGNSLAGLPEKYWQTQVFLTFGYGPIFPSMSVFIADRKDGFAANDEGNYRIDGLRHKFHNGVYFLPDKVLSEFELGQWTSPMKGLLAAYVYFSSPEKDKESLFRNVAYDLSALLGDDCPDVKALQIMAAQYYKTPPPHLSLSVPCMFLAGMRAVIRASIKHPDIIADGSLLEDIADQLYNDMVWTSYVPAPLPEARKTKIFTIPDNSLANSIYNVVERIIGTETTPEQIGEKLLKSQTVSTLLYYIEKLDDELNVNDLASRLQIPPNVIRKTINHILLFSDSIRNVKSRPDQFSISNINKLKSIQS